MRIDWWTLGFQTVNVLVLVWLMSRFLFKPLAKIMADRQQAVAALMQDAAAARDAAEHDRKQITGQVAELDALRMQRLNDVSAEAERLKSSLLAAARAEADALRASAAAEIEAMRQRASRGNAAQAAGFALEIASRLLARLPRDGQISGFIEPLAAAVRALPVAHRQQLGQQREALRLVAPRALDDGELAHCREALATALGHEATLRVDIDPALIAGLELAGQHVIVRNSFRHDLDTLKAELLAHDDERHD
ncbi:F0F1 ATP synthase subunit B [Burkholderia cepacia]|uniref:F0F1 ATP synthase subunit B family protein n=1 Tax=Burkholderia cepacia TaxID=292 RepID=UPI00158A5367|nr:F0F1 ATP synthase subunit B [Burkholderia cepacia]